jgi:hypothetical protein
MEDRLDLKVTSGPCEGIPVQADTEAARAVYESDDPSRIELE